MSSPNPATLVVVNPASAGGRTHRRWPEIDAALRAAGVEASVHVTGGVGEAIGVTRRAIAEDGVRRVVAVGGDGTLNEVVNGCFGPDGRVLATSLTVGLIPSGTGGDFGRSLGLPQTPAGAAALLAAGVARPIDIGRVVLADGTVRHFANEASCGIGAEVVARVALRPRRGAWRLRTGTFLVEALGALFRYRNRTLELRLDSRVIRARAQQVVVANGRSYGEGMLIAPGARPDDGVFDVVLVGDITVAGSLLAVPRLYRGTHVRLPIVRVERSRSVRVVAAPGEEPPLVEADGELLGRAPAEITLLPGALRVAAPAEPVAAAGGRERRTVAGSPPAR